LRVLLCIDSLGVGGKERQAVELIKGLSETDEVECCVVCFSNEDFYQHCSLAVDINFIVRRVRWDFQVFRRLRRLVMGYRPDVIHSNGLVSSFYSLPLARLAGIPFINGSIRNAFARHGCRWTLERYLLKWSDYRLANSRAGLRSRMFSEEDPRNVVIYNGFDFARVKDVNTVSVGPTLDKQTVIIGMVAEFNPYKDYLTYLEAARLLGGSRHDLLFLCVGGGEMLKRCQTAAAGLRNVQFLGERKNVEEIVETFDIGVLCTFVEGLSNSIMEYMALGKPVVATDGGGTRELVVDGETGMLVPASDPAALASAIEHLVEHPDLRQRMGTAGQVKIRTQLSLDRMIEQTVALYQQAVTH
jgi:glycosyltransferase involved in cell wall biosynthesis